jgi:hypothetical protein
VDAVPRERVQIERLDGDEGLSFARPHLGDVALVEDDAAHQLDVEKADAHRAFERLPHGREGLEDQLVDGLAILDPLSELGGLARQLGVAERLELRLEGADVRGLLGKALDATALAEAQDLLQGSELLGHSS